LVVCRFKYLLHVTHMHGRIRLRYVNDKKAGTLVKALKIAPNFKTISQMDVPHSRNGKHKKIVSLILSDLDQLHNGTAVRVPLADLADSKENVRSALNRATRKNGWKVSTATDGEFLYVWNLPK
jgi:hypothetical protein